ncbi:hypothetical protein [Pseudogemmobacter bohemicus]|uniref:hypothetical protein n=1 Tax=Pseudogemmobacter bohemicus TaxID=2250708 RepID=UPI000DD4D92F|nr:hypothetical protein [Pseudogemmobacter bohemicus]
MNTTVPITPASPSWHLPVIEFGRSADGLLVSHADNLGRARLLRGREGELGRGKATGHEVGERLPLPVVETPR